MTDDLVERVADAMSNACANRLQCRENERDLAIAEEKIAFLMKTHDDMAEELEHMRECLLDIVAIVGLDGDMCGQRVLNAARFALSFAELEDSEEKFQPYTCSRCLGTTENADDLCDDCANEASDE